MKETKDIDWKSLGFHYTEPDYIVRCGYHDGKWGKPYATRKKTLELHVAATCLQYGQEAFEGLKAFRGADGKVRIFRMFDNALRLQSSAKGLYMASVPVEVFEESVLLALKKNMAYLPPYESGATLYFRPLLIGTTPRLGVGPGRDFEFIVIPSPIGPYYPGGFCCTPFVVNRTVDRAAPLGTGQFKVGGNYAASFRATELTHNMGMGCLFTDAKRHKYIDECGAANFFAIRKNADGTAEYVTPKSESILPSITNDSLMTLAKEMGMKVRRRHIPVDELSSFQEAAACGTAAVISPISRVIDAEKGKTYEFGDTPGSVCRTLYNRLLDIQYGRAEDKYGWTMVIDN